jgi:hypothetical protein
VRREQLETRYDRTTTLTRTSSTAPLLTAGGGVEFLLGNRLVLAPDARYQRLFEKDRFHRIDIPPNVDLVRVGSAMDTDSDARCRDPTRGFPDSMIPRFPD